MSTDEIIEIIKKSHLKTEDYFETTIFYYMAGRFPNLTICECTEIIEEIRNKIINEIRKGITENKNMNREEKTFDPEKGESL